MSGWGLKFFDFDDHGAVDLPLANGHPEDMVEVATTGVKYKEPLLLFHQDAGTLHNISSQLAPVFAKSFPARGLAVGDFNNDGHIDVLVGNNGEAPLLLRNNAGMGNHWVGLKLQGVHCNRDAIGARLTWSVGGVKRTKLKNNGGGSYFSSHDLREVLGLGASTQLHWVEIKWRQPSGIVQRSNNLPIDRYVTIVEGQDFRE